MVRKSPVRYSTSLFIDKVVVVSQSVAWETRNIDSPSFDSPSSLDIFRSSVQPIFTIKVRICVLTRFSWRKNSRRRTISNEKIWSFGVEKRTGIFLRKSSSAIRLTCNVMGASTNKIVAFGVDREFSSDLWETIACRTRQLEPLTKLRSMVTTLQPSWYLKSWLPVIWIFIWNHIGNAFFPSSRNDTTQQQNRTISLELPEAVAKAHKVTFLNHKDRRPLCTKHQNGGAHTENWGRTNYVRSAPTKLVLRSRDTESCDVISPAKLNGETELALKSCDINFFR